MLGSYLPAFEALYHGSTTRAARFSHRVLKGKRILITGGATLEAQAIIRLARYAGASEIYVIAPREHFEVLNKQHVTVLDDHPTDFLPVIRDKMDIIIDYEFPRNFMFISQALARKGRLVCVTPKRSVLDSSNCVSDVMSFFERLEVSLMKRASLFDFSEYYTMNPEVVYKDLNFLLKLLTTRQIRPNIERFVKLCDLPKAHREMQTRPLTGAVICEPWKDF
jgi:NADPH:quinone reductase-like Zn-dependent oxidoreductase